MEKNKIDEIIKNNLLLMKYNNKKTLSENKEVILKEGQAAGVTVGSLLGVAACYGISTWATIFTGGLASPAYAGCALLGTYLGFYASEASRNQDLVSLTNTTIDLGQKLATKFKPVPSEGFNPETSAEKVYNAFFESNWLSNLGLGWGTDEDELRGVIGNIQSPVDMYLLDKYFREYGEGGLAENFNSELDEKDQVPFKRLLQSVYDNAMKAQKALEDAGIEEEKKKKEDEDKKGKKEKYNCLSEIGKKFHSDTVAIPSEDGDGFCQAYYNAGTQTFDSGRLICFNNASQIIGRGFWTCTGGGFKVTKYVVESSNYKNDSILNELKIAGQDLDKSFDDSAKYKKPDDTGGKKTDNSGGGRSKIISTWEDSPSCENVSGGTAVIEKGMKGECVGEIQEQLNKVNSAGLAVDNKFGKLTKGAVENFQTKNQISPADGKVDKKTYEKLFVNEDPNVLDVEKEIPTLSTESKNKSSKRLITENAKYNMDDALAYCFERFINKGVLVSYDKTVKTGTKTGKKYITGKNAQEKTYFFFDDGSYSVASYDENQKKWIKDPKLDGTWSCPIDKYKSERTTTDLKAKQDDYINKLKQEFPGKNYIIDDDRDKMFMKVAKGEYLQLDLHNLKPELFTEKNKYFIYEPVSNELSASAKQLIAQYSGSNYVEVDCDAPVTDDYATNVIKFHENEQFKKYFSRPYCMVVKTDYNLTPNTWNTFLDNSYSEITAGINSPTKKLCRQVINNYEQAMTKQMRVRNSGIFDPIKEFIKACSSQHNFHAGTKSALQKILVSNKTRYGNYGLNESLTNRVKNNLLEVKENKKNFLVETHIVQNRFKLIVESSNPKNKKRIYDRLISEIITLKSTGISDKVISEQLEGLFNMFKGLFGGDKAGSNIMGGIGGTFVEYGVQFLLRFIGLNPNSVVGRIFVTSIGNIGGFENIPKILTDCKFTSELLAKSIVEAMAGSFIDNNIGTGFLADGLRNVFADVAFNTEIVKSIQSKISDKVCEALDSLDNKAESVTKEIKQKALS
jgi:peptidoglycan hydrolase-like protein with peptidoglycan-binding domain